MIHGQNGYSGRIDPANCAASGVGGASWGDGLLGYRLENYESGKGTVERFGGALAARAVQVGGDSLRAAAGPVAGSAQTISNIGTLSGAERARDRERFRHLSCRLARRTVANFRAPQRCSGCGRKAGGNQRIRHDAKSRVFGNKCIVESRMSVADKEKDIYILQRMRG